MTEEHNSNLVKAHLPCPECNSSDAYAEYDDGHGYCYSCNYNSNNVDRNDAGNYTYEYLPWRGVSGDIFRAYRSKTKIDKDGKPIAIGFRYPNDTYKVRLLDKKEFYTEGSLGGLFGQDKFSAGSARTVTITEGELDALSIYQAVHAPVVSVRSSSTAVRDCIAARSWLNSFERIILAFDADRPGLDACREVAKLFDYNKVFVLRPDKGRKDANDYLQHGEEAELKELWYNAKKYLPETIVGTLADFKTILEEKPTASIPYPFKTLQDMTFGIRQGESVLITAQEGIGKTEFMHCLEHHILKESPNEKLAGIFLEEPKRRHLETLSGIELGEPVHLPGVATSDRVYGAIQKLVGQDDRLFIYSHFGSDDPDVILDTIRFLGSACDCRNILLDHITMVVSGLLGDDERRALDYISTRLEMMVKELGLALIIVSHVNDVGQTRGSRLISKVADIRIDLNRNLQAENEIERRIINLNISKNRFSGRTGPAGQILFDPDTRKFTELNVGGFHGDNLQSTT